MIKLDSIVSYKGTKYKVVGVHFEKHTVVRIMIVINKKIEIVSVQDVTEEQ